MSQNYHSDAQKVIRDFLRSNPTPCAPFWSIRDISKKYDFSEHAAYSILKILSDTGYLDMAPKRRASLRRHVDMSLLSRSVGPLRPAFIWPFWKGSEDGNFILDFSNEISALCEKLMYPFVFLDNPSAWGAPPLVLQLKAVGANALLTVAPPASALILFTRLKSDDLPIVSLGSSRQGYDELGVVTIDGDKTEAMRMLMLRLRSLGVKLPLIVGYGASTSCHAERVAGLKAAYPEIEDVEAAGFFTNVGEPYSQIRELKSRLSQRKLAPDALVFSDFQCLELAMTCIPTLGEGALDGRYFIAVFDDTGLSRRVNFPVISMTLPADRLAAKSLEILRNLRDGVRVPQRTLLRRAFNWPNNLREKQTAESYSSRP